MDRPILEPGKEVRARKTGLHQGKTVLAGRRLSNLGSDAKKKGGE
jgi:hypothetical protein